MTDTPPTSSAAETTAVQTGPDGSPLPPETTGEPPPADVTLEEGADLDGPSDEAQEGAPPPEERLHGEGAPA